MAHKSIIVSKYDCLAKAGEFNGYGACHGNLEWHHMWHGNANRAVADQEKLTCWLCNKHHRLVHDKGNLGRKFDEDLMEFSEAVWITYNKKTVRDFYDKFHKNVLDTEW